MAHKRYDPNGPSTLPKTAVRGPEPQLTTRITCYVLPPSPLDHTTTGTSVPAMSVTAEPRNYPGLPRISLSRIYALACMHACMLLRWNGHFNTHRTSYREESPVGKFDQNPPDFSTGKKKYGRVFQFPAESPVDSPVIANTLLVLYYV